MVTVVIHAIHYGAWGKLHHKSCWTYRKFKTSEENWNDSSSIRCLCLWLYPPGQHITTCSHACNVLYYKGKRKLIKRKRVNILKKIIILGISMVSKYINVFSFFLVLNSVCQILFKIIVQKIKIKNQFENVLSIHSRATIYFCMHHSHVCLTMICLRNNGVIF